MLVFRVFPHLAGAGDGEEGSATYLYPFQGRGRLDNPSEYLVWYFALEPAGAVGETFGDLPYWSEEMFEFPALPRARRSLAVYRLPDDAELLELDDAKALLKRGLRPTQVIERNRSATQLWALDIYRERNDRGERTWSGVRWWSYHRPSWRIVGAWRPAPQVVSIEKLTLDHPAVVDAADVLRRQIVR